MKKLFIFALLLVQVAVYSQAQLNVEMHERPSSMGIHPAFEAAVPKAGVKVAEELFKNSMQERKMLGLIKRKADSKKSGEEWMTEKFVFESVSEKPMVILFQAADYADLTYVRFFFIQNDRFLGSPEYESKKVIRNAESFVRRFAVKLYQQTIDNEIAEENKVLAKLEKKSQKLKRTGKKLRKKMANKKDEYFGELIELNDPGKIDGIKKEQNGQARKLKGYEKKMKRNYKQQKDINNQIESQKKEIEKLTSNLKRY